MIRISKIWRWLPLAIILIFVLFIRVRFLDIPLERDEGEYAYFGQLMLQGVPPYQLAYNMKLPGTSFMYAVMMALFGQTVRGVHLGFLLINIISIVLIFFLSKKFVSHTAALISSATYALLSLSSSMMGFAAHATHFVVLPVIAGFLLLLKAFKHDKRPLLLWSGVSFGLAVLMKQHSLFFCMFGAAAVIFNGLRSKRAISKKLIFNFLCFLIGVISPYMLTMLVLYSAGVFDKFWFWTKTYIMVYGSQIPLSLAVNYFKTQLQHVTADFYLLWTLSALGLIVTFFHSKSRNWKLMILLFSFFSFLSICPGFYFRPHYFITLLPAAAILTGVFFDFLRTRLIKSKYLIAGLFLTAALIGIGQQKEYLFKEEPSAISRRIYGGNPFPESIEIAKFIRSRTNKNDTVAVMGSEPQIYFYSDRHSATGYIYMYSLMEKNKYSLAMQKEMAREIEASKPKFLVFVYIHSSWLRNKSSKSYIFNWASSYISKELKLSGIIDILPDKTIYKWGNDVNNYRIRSNCFLKVFERRS